MTKQHTTESYWDRRLSRTAEKLIAGDKAGKKLETILKRSCPEVYQQIAENSRYPKMLGLWGESYNFDEHARRRIVHPAIVQLIGRIAGIEMKGRIVHAGLQHTYAYLFSLIDTPYGFKRERWVETGLEQGLAVDEDALGPCPRQGTLLSNATYLLGRIAFRGRRKELAVLRQHRHLVDEDLLGLPFRSMKSQKILERFRAPSESGKHRDVTLHTDLVRLPFDKQTAQNASTLLAYSIVDQSKPSAQLITAFTVTAASVQELLRLKTGERVEINVKFNAHVEGIDRNVVLGNRSISSLK